MILLNLHLVHAELVPIKDPELDYIRTPETTRLEWGISPSEYIIRLNVDLDNTGNKAILLTFKGMGSKGGPVWTAYAPVASGYVRTDGIQFREDFYRAGKVPEVNPTGGLVALYPGKGGGKLVKYSLNEVGMLIGEDVMNLDYENPDHQQLFKRVFGRNLSEMMPDEFFNKLSHQVIEVKSIEARAVAQPRGENTAAPPQKLHRRQVLLCQSSLHRPRKHQKRSPHQRSLAKNRFHRHNGASWCCWFWELVG